LHRALNSCVHITVLTHYNHIITHFQLPEYTEEDPKAVMFWIHGGGFYLGSSNTSFYGPDYLMTGDVILVTFNYRLGPLGGVKLIVK
jgi:acetyl esterase/lipase